MSTLEERLEAALAGTPLAGRWREAAAPLLERGDRDALAELDEAVVRGLARLLASQAEAAGFLARRRSLLARLAALDAGYLERRGAELDADAALAYAHDLEAWLDELRLLRREETLLAACLDFSGLVPFEAVSAFLSRLAEAIVRAALRVAEEQVASGPGDAPLAVVGMGKIGGREFTYHSDLDLVFLYAGTPGQITRAARVGQRLIAHLSTMTGAGVAYAVDTRLRPSGQQGTLVTSLEAFERYQRDAASTWEHLVLMRARVLADGSGRARAVLERTREAVISATRDPWPEVESMRSQVERERVRGGPELVEFKTGAGGLMDMDFLAEGGVLERGRSGLPEVPSIEALLRHAVQGPRVEGLLEGYRFLRRVEARARWHAGRPVEAVRRDGGALSVVAELVEPGLGASALLERVRRERERIREAFQAVVAARSIAVLEAGGRVAERAMLGPVSQE